MVDDGSGPGASWPIPKFNFEVRWGEVVMAFQEVSGLDVEAQPIEYRHGDSQGFTVTRMPGMRKFSDVTLKRGVFAADDRFWAWSNKIKMNTVKRSTVTISLLDDAGGPAMVWKLANAWPVEITGTDAKSDGGEVAVETLVIAHEGLTIANG